MAKSRRRAASPPEDDVIGCSVKELPEDEQVGAAHTAIEINPANRPLIGLLAKLLPDKVMEKVERPAFLSVLTSKFWGSDGAKLTVSFFDNPTKACRDLILAHMNAWYNEAHVNIQFLPTDGTGDVRVAFERSGYWSYLGTDIKHIPNNKQTMNLQGFTERTALSEYRRVVRHETGHTMGFPHEHMRGAIIARLDPEKTYDYFARFQGWDRQTTKEQVLTPLSESSIRGTTDADDDSIMCYQLPASITRDGIAIPGGNDINPTDAAFAAKQYPLAAAPPPVVPAGLIHIDPVAKRITFPNGWAAALGN